MKLKRTAFALIFFVVTGVFFYYLLSSDVNQKTSNFNQNVNNLSNNMMFLKKNNFLVSSLEFHSSGSVTTMLKDFLRAHKNGPKSAFLYSQEDKNIFAFSSFDENKTISTMTYLLEHDNITFKQDLKSDTGYTSNLDNIFVYTPVATSRGKTFFLVAVVDKESIRAAFPYVKDISINDAMYTTNFCNVATVDYDYTNIAIGNSKVIFLLIVISLLLFVLIYDILKAYQLLKEVLGSLSEGKISVNLNQKSLVFQNLLNDVNSVCANFKKKNEALHRAKLERKKNLSKIDGIVESAQTIAHDTCEVESMFKGLMEDAFILIKDIREYLKQLKVDLPNEIAFEIASLNKNYALTNKYTKYAFQLIRDLKLIGKDDQINLKKTDVSEVIEKLIDEINILVPEHIHLDVTYHHTKKIELDEKMFLRIVYNIFKNCLEAADYDSKVWITTEDSSSGVNIKIGNTGSYIHEDKIKEVMQKNISSGKAGGTGLGLFIADKLLKRHNSNYEIRSNEPDCITEFIVHLKESVYV